MYQHRQYCVASNISERLNHGTVFARAIVKFPTFFPDQRALLLNVIRKTNEPSFLLLGGYLSFSASDSQQRENGFDLQQALPRFFFLTFLYEGALPFQKILEARHTTCSGWARARVKNNSRAQTEIRQPQWDSRHVWVGDCWVGSGLKIPAQSDLQFTVHIGLSACSLLSYLEQKHQWKTLMYGINMNDRVLILHWANWVVHSEVQVQSSKYLRSQKTWEKIQFFLSYKFGCTLYKSISARFSEENTENRKTPNGLQKSPFGSPWKK